jgi:LuxR family maltose regulon positive regulatory protein
LSLGKSLKNGTDLDPVRENSAEAYTIHSAIPPDSQGCISIVKITPPRSSGIFPRARLFRLLDSLRKHAVTWVSAPAGSGKTTLIASYLACRKIPCIWYRVDEGDADIATFFYYMGLAAKVAAPQKRKPLPLLSPEYLPGISTFTLRYFESLYGRLNPPLVIVFDNYQHVSGRSKFHEIIREGMDILPEGISVIVLSRENPPPQLARLRAGGGLAFLGADEMRFTLEETGRMVRLKGLKGLSDKIIHLLHERTQGWAAGLVLVMESVRATDKDYQILSKLTDGEIFDYFASEIFEKTDAETRIFLLRTAFLPRMTVGMAEKLTDVAQAEDILNRLYRDNFFTEKNYGIRPVYQYHPLFREFLLSRAKAVMAPEEVHGIRQTSARILEESGQIEDAADLFIAAGEWEEMAGLILAHAESLVGQGRSETLGEWLKKLPKDTPDRSPWLLYWTGICRMGQSPAESRGDFERAFNAFHVREYPPGELLAWCGIVDSILYEWDDFKLLDPWIEWLDRRMSPKDSFPSPEIGSRVASSMAGALIWRYPYRLDILQWLGRAMSLSRESGDLQLQLQTFANAAAYFVTICDLRRLNIVTQQAKEISRSFATSPVPPIILKCAESVLQSTFMADGQQSLAAVADGLEIARKSGVRILDHMLFAHGVYAAFALGDMTMAREYLDKMEAALENGSRQSKSHYLFLSAWYNLLLGKIPQAIVQGETALQLVLESGAVFPEITCRHLMAKILHDMGKREEALHQLSIAKRMISRSGEEFYFDYICLLTEAQFAFDSAEEEKGLELLRKATALGKRRSYRAISFHWQPSVLALLCKKALEAGIETDYVRNYVRGQDLFPDQPPVELADWPWPVKIITLGKFDLLLDGKSVRFSGKVQRKPLRLLKALIALGSKEIKEEQLTDLLWPEADGDQAHSAFTTALLRLRRLIGHDKAIEIREGRASLNPKYCWVDLWAAELMLGQAETRLKEIGESEVEGKGDREKIVEIVEKAIGMYDGPFLPDEGNQSWVLPLRERLQRRFSRLIVKFGSYLEVNGQWEKAAMYYQMALDTDGIAGEELYQKLMVCHYHLGQYPKAIEVYLLCKKNLSSMLGIRPSPKTEAIYRNLVV